MSAVSIIGMAMAGRCASSHALRVSSRCTCGWTRLIDSTPPATATGTPSRTMRRAAEAMASSPEAQKRETVTPAEATGTPAMSEARRATLPPVEASG